MCDLCSKARIASISFEVRGCRTFCFACFTTFVPLNRVSLQRFFCLLMICRLVFDGNKFRRIASHVMPSAIVKKECQSRMGRQTGRRDLVKCIRTVLYSQRQQIILRR